MPSRLCHITEQGLSCWVYACVILQRSIIFCLCLLRSPAMIGLFVLKRISLSMCTAIEVGAASLCRGGHDESGAKRRPSLRLCRWPSSSTSSSLVRLDGLLIRSSGSHGSTAIIGCRSDTSEPDGCRYRCRRPNPCRRARLTDLACCSITR